MILELNTSDQNKWSSLMEAIRKSKNTCHAVPGKNILVVSNETDKNIFTPFESIIAGIFLVDTPYQLASKQFTDHTSFAIKEVQIGSPHFNIIAGPCSVENEEQIFTTAAFLQNSGIRMMRGGAYKPRTSPYSFRGLGKQGLELIRKAAYKHNQLVVTEILDLQFLDEVYQYADILQVGSRNMQNFHLLNELGKINKPILLKRGMQAKTKEWLLAAEYILCGGNEKVILCERGIRSFDPDTRNVMDIGIIPLIKELSHLPIIADPSHGTGAASRVLPVSLAAAAAGADGLIIEIHPNPEKALSDSKQALSFDAFTNLLDSLHPMLKLLHKSPESESSFLKLQTL